MVLEELSVSEQQLNFKKKSNMKKVIYLLSFIGMAFVGCNPVEDIHNEIDSQDNSVEGSTEYTLTSEDYADLVEQGEDEEADFYETYEAFSDVDDAKLMLPDFLSSKYPFWGQGSSVTVNYNLYDGNPEDVSLYVNADYYELTSADYPQGDLNAVGFYPNEYASDYINDILTMQFSTAIEGQVVLVEYNEYTAEPIEGYSNLVDVDFVEAQTLLDWETQSVSGDEAWAGTQYGATMDGSPTFPGSNVNEDWLISPAIDLSTEINPLFQVTQILNYSAGDDWYNIMISTDYVDDVTTATWTNIEVSPSPTGDSWSSFTSDDYNLSAYEGETIHIGFKYESDITTGATWEIEQVLVKVPGVEGETLSKNMYYKYTGSEWDLVDNVYYLSSGDYDSMGTSSGQPGQYNNFSSSVLPADYLPQFLNINYPYAQEDETLFVVYKYYEGSTVTKGNLYTFTSGEWVPSVATLQFGFTDGIWVPDNTIRYTVASSDYSLVASTLLTEPGFESAAGNLDSYGNFNRTGGSSAWTDSQMKTAIGVVLDNLDPNAEEGQKYIVTVDVYNGASGTEDFPVIKTDGVWDWQNPEDYDE